MCILKLKRIFSNHEKIHTEKDTKKYISKNCVKCQQPLNNTNDDHNGLCYWCFAWQENKSFDTDFQKRRVIPFIVEK